MKPLDAGSRSGRARSSTHLGAGLSYVSASTLAVPFFGVVGIFPRTVRARGATLSPPGARERIFHIFLGRARDTFRAERPRPTCFTFVDTVC